MDLLLAWQVVELKYKLLTVINDLKEDPNYEREDAINDLIEILKLLDGLEQSAKGHTF